MAKRRALKKESHSAAAEAKVPPGKTGSPDRVIEMEPVNTDAPCFLPDWKPETTDWPEEEKGQRVNARSLAARATGRPAAVAAAIVAVGDAEVGPAEPAAVESAVVSWPTAAG